MIRTTYFLALIISLGHLSLAMASEASSGAATATCHKPRGPGETSSAIKPTKRAQACLVSPAQLSGASSIVDLRPRAAYAAFHVPEARNQQLSQLLTKRSPQTVVYDGGRLTQDGILLCQRLRHYGLNDVQVIEGGVAAWAQAKDAPQAIEVSRLDDTEVVSALLSGRAPVTAMSAEFSAVLATLQLPSTSKGAQEIVLAESVKVASRRLAQKRPSVTVLYWVGEPARLQTLVKQLLAQDRKRELGPGYSPNCSSL